MTEAPSLRDYVLDALDDAPVGSVLGEEPYDGPIATIQWLSARTGYSDSAVREAVRFLHWSGLVRVFDVRDPSIGHRRLMVTGAAS